MYPSTGSSSERMPSGWPASIETSDVSATSMITRCIQIALVTAGALVCVTARAQEAPPVTPTSDARARFRKGNELFKQHAWAAALAELLESRKLHPTMVATANAAYCLRQLERYDEALDLYESLLRDFKDVPADLKDETQRAIVELRGLVGTIEIGESEPGAAISIDGRARGEYPSIEPLRVAAGSHTVRLYKDGFEPFETRVEVAGRKTVPIDAKLRPLVASGRLKVIEQGGRALEVLLDGSLVGKTPWEGRVPVGEHVVLLRGEGDLGTAPTSVSVELSRTVPLTLVAEELAAVLQIEPVPASARVAIDSVAVGRGIWEGRLRVGEHKIEVAEPGFLTATLTVTLARGKRERTKVTLERDASSPFWRKPARPSRFMLEMAVSSPLVPFGGAITSDCVGTCSLSTGIGTHGMLRGGYELGWGFGLGAMAGWYAARQVARGRDTSLQELAGEGAATARVDDTLRLRGVLVGGWLGYRLDTAFPIQARLNAGALLAVLSDARAGTITSSAGDEHRFGTIVERHDARFLFLAPELRIGIPLSPHVELSAGIEVPILVPTERALWSTTVAAGSGGGTFAFDDEPLTSAVLVTFAPGLGARFDF
jgi:hypothetical protein